MVNYGPTVFAIKASILLFLTRVFSPYKTYVRWIYGFLVCISIYYAVMMLCKILICRPISMFWGATTNGTCFDERSLILTDSVISVVSDAVVLLLPLPLTKDLQVGIKAKLKIGLVFGVGGIAVVFSLIRLVFIIQEGQSADQTYAFLQINLFGYVCLAPSSRSRLHSKCLQTLVFEWDAGPDVMLKLLMCLRIAECGIGVVCACFPLLPALWKSILHKTKSGYSSNSKSQFEMMPSSQKPSRTAAHHHGTIIYKNETDSDENDLISRAKPNVMTDIRAANDDLHGSGVGSKCHHNDRWDDSQIVRTVEVFQYVEE